VAGHVWQHIALSRDFVSLRFVALVTSAYQMRLVRLGCLRHLVDRARTVVYKV